MSQRHLEVVGAGCLEAWERNRKCRESHSLQRYGLMERSQWSTNSISPALLDLWVDGLPQLGQW